MEIIRIPEERIRILIGQNGKTKKEIENKAGVELKISKDGEVAIEGSEDKVYFSKEIIKAIGRGFSPKIALKLLKDEKTLEIINLKEFGNTQNAIKRIKARIIGEEGKVKKEIESATDSDISIYGNTIGIIANYDCVDYSKQAVMKIISGAEHSTVFNYLSEVKRKLFQERLK
ncbi:MAG: KH domain-containing protein [Candidatus ainarchaeum sp.]|nr:KH domain-containing protein [Candidatus ainarchaeum sp.]